jgi:phosphoribosylanthranilate isomerase
MSALVKICGVRSPEIAQVVAEVGADFLGLIFAPSRRRVSVAEARRIAQSASVDRDRRPLVVGVFVDEAAERIAEIAEEVRLDLVQLSGDEPPVTVSAVDRPAIKVLRLPSGTSLDAARREAERYLSADVPPVALMLDTHVPGSYGGSGLTGDWTLAARLAVEYPVFLAGGLDAGNAAEAVAFVAPLGVDVSSGVETDGEKDADKIRRFVATIPRPAGDVRPSATDLLAIARFGARNPR